MINRTAWIVTGALGVLGMSGGSALAAGPFSTPGADATRITDTAPVSVGLGASADTSSSAPLVDPTQSVQNSAITTVAVATRHSHSRQSHSRHSHSRHSHPGQHSRPVQPVQHA